jgi:prepilin peptidase CpaA
MLSPDFHIALPIILTIMLTIALAWDAASFRIPNWINASILIFYPISYLLFDTQADWLMALAGFAVVFGVGYVIFAFNIMGGGDIKMLAVCGLWIEWSYALFEYVLGVALIGGLISLALIVGRPTVAYIASKCKEGTTIPRVLSYGEPVPFGIAIGSAFIIMMWGDMIPALRYAG